MPKLCVTPRTLWLILLCWPKYRFVFSTTEDIEVTEETWALDRALAGESLDGTRALRVGQVEEIKPGELQPGLRYDQNTVPPRFP
jgi:hypothetical protein